MKYHKHEIRNVTRTQLNKAIDESVIGFKSARNRAILKRRLCDGVTFEELAEEYDMSVMQIKNIIYKEMEIISQYLEVEV